MHNEARPTPEGIHAPTAVDPQGPLIEALQGFEKQLAQDSENEEEAGDGSAAVIALGIMEILKLLKDNQAREHMRETERFHAERERDHIIAEQHTRQLDEIRLEIREWEAKRAELELNKKDPEHKAGIDTIIALLKDQMADQERKMADLKQAVTPQLASLNDDTQDAIHEMKEHFINDLGAFKQEMDSEVKKTLNEVAELREQKKQLQSDLSGLLAFKAKYLGGAPEHATEPGLDGPAQSSRMPPLAARFGGPPANPPARPDSSAGLYARGMRGPR